MALLKKTRKRGGKNTDKKTENWNIINNELIGKEGRKCKKIATLVWRGDKTAQDFGVIYMEDQHQQLKSNQYSIQ